MISPTQDPDVIKNKTKEIFKSGTDIPIPRDVLMTNTNKVILKTSNRVDSGIIKDKIMEGDALKKWIKVNIPRRKYERILILSVDPGIDEDLVRNSIKRILEKSTSISNVVKEISRKMQSSSLDKTARDALQEPFLDTALDFNIVRRIKTKNGRINWLIDIDRNGRDVLLGYK